MQTRQRGRKAADVFRLSVSSDLMYLTHSTAEKEKPVKRSSWISGSDDGSGGRHSSTSGENSLMSHASKNVISWIFPFFKTKKTEIVLYTRIRRQVFIFFFLTPNANTMKVVPSTRVESSRGPVLLYSFHHVITGCVFVLLWDFCCFVVVVIFNKQPGDWLPGCRVVTR